MRTNPVRRETKRRVLLRNGNPQGDPRNAPRCGAKTRKGTSCRAPAMKNGRCRMHGGKSTGPRTPEGLARSRKANWKHGMYSAEAIEQRLRMRELIRMSNELTRRMKEAGGVQRRENNVIRIEHSLRPSGVSFVDDKNQANTIPMKKQLTDHKRCSEG